jgi:transposase
LGLIIGTPNRFHRGKQIGNYVGLIPSEDSSGGKQRLGHISKQGNSLLRFLLVEAARPRRGTMRTGGVGTRTWQCVGTRALPRWRWAAGWESACTGCGETAAPIRRQWSSVRTRDSSVPDMV